ncbi:MAG: peroxiredoxin [Candidatus Calescibacterium sp.]|jgi:peroxiredoxin Q/BCP|nr:peroxiredoxin [Candidatus Calescibacterium sp.]
MLKVGDKLPEFEGVLTSGKNLSSKDLLGKWVVLFFFPKAFTPGCTNEVCSVNDNIENLKKLGVEVFGISKDKLSTQKRFKEKYDLKYELIADESGDIIKKFGISRKTGSAERKTFIIDPEGKVAYIFEKVDVKNHGKEIEQVLLSLFNRK